MRLICLCASLCTSSVWFILYHALLLALNWQQGLCSFATGQTCGTHLHARRVLGLAEDLQHFVVGKEEEARKRDSLDLQVCRQPLLDVVQELRGSAWQSGTPSYTIVTKAHRQVWTPLYWVWTTAEGQ